MMLAIVASSVDTVTPPPRTDEALGPDPLEALIEEARRRARRRRLRYAAAALFASAAGMAAFDAFRGGGGDAAPPARERPPEAAAGRVDVANGPLTLADVQTTDNSTPAGYPPRWYPLSTLGPDGELHPLVRCGGGADWCGEVEGLDWSPDGEWLAFGVISFVLPNAFTGLHLFNPATGEDRQIRECNPFECDWFDIDWSPNGAKLAYVSNGDVVIVNSDGTGATVLVSRSFGRNSSPSWSPSGDRLAFASRSNGRSGVYVVRADGTQRRLLVDDASAPAWSPDGTAIAYRMRCGVRLITPDGDDVTPATPFRCGWIGIDGRPVWSPDGTKIAIAGTTTSALGAPVRGTYVVNADGTDPALVTTKTQLTYVGVDARPAWRPIRRAR